MNVIEELKESIKKGNIITQIIYINIAAFLFAQLVMVFYFFSGVPHGQVSFLDLFKLPSNLSILARQPWSIITYMFYHEEFLHILFNLLVFYWFGKIFLGFLTARKLLSVYILGGITGAIFYIGAFNLLPVFTNVVGSAYALGASAAIIAIVAAISFYIPGYTINLLFIGPVKLIYIALFYIVLDIISIPVSNAGGHLAHLGGAFFGYIFISCYKRNIDITKWLESIFDFIATIFKPRNRMKVSYKRPVSDLDFNGMRNVNQKEIDEILDKISKGGYDSLTKKEKEILFKNSQKN
jgi:membrane associated rhomboid family serine protease